MYEKEKDFIKSVLTERELLEGLAEESAELSQAALKLIRSKHSNNFTPVPEEEAISNVLEEIGDIIMLIDILGYDITPSSQNCKWSRWCSRLKERN